MAKVSIYHFHNGGGGGVLSAIRNLLLYRQHTEIENHVIYTINKDFTSFYHLPCLFLSLLKKLQIYDLYL